MRGLFIFTIILAIISFFLIIVFTLAAISGYLPNVEKEYQNKLFYSGVMTILITVGSFVATSFKYVTFNARPFIGFSFAIRNIQKALLKEKIIKTYPDGILGKDTFRSIIDFQKKYSLPYKDGRIDKVTIDSIFNYESRPDSPLNNENPHFMLRYLVKPSFSTLNDQVKWLQSILAKQVSYNGPIDGILKPELLDAVRDFQYKKGVEVDGTIGFETFLMAIETDINRLMFLKRILKRKDKNVNKSTENDLTKF